MNKHKMRFTSILVLLLFACNTIWAQDDYSFYLQKARQSLAEGDCDGAQRSYNVYKDLAKKTDNAIEQMIANCGSQRVDDKPLTYDELKRAGFRFYKHNKSVKVLTSSGEQRRIYKIIPNKEHDVEFVDNMVCYGGNSTNSGLVNGVVILKGSTRYIAYVCEGKMAFPIIEIGYYDGGLYMSLEEGNVSYGCIFPSWDSYSGRCLCQSIREVYGIDFSDPGVLDRVYNLTIDINSLEKAFKQFVRSGKSLACPWSSDPEYTSDYE